MKDRRHENSSDISELALTGGSAALLRTLELMRRPKVSGALKDLTGLTQAAMGATRFLDGLCNEPENAPAQAKDNANGPLDAFRAALRPNKDKTADAG